MRLIVIAATLLLTGCRQPQLHLFSNYITLESLASYHVRTPDPALLCPPLGQRLFVEWNIKKCHFSPDMVIKLSLHFGDHTTATETITLLKAHGRSVYELKDAAFFSKKGIVAYKAELMLDSQVIDEWRHLLWVDRITF